MLVLWLLCDGMSNLGEITHQTPHPEASHDAAGALEAKGDRRTLPGGDEKSATP
jgi:hypothetical protein